MRSLLDKESILNDRGFSEVVNIIEESLQPVRLRVIDNDERKVFVGDIFCKLSPKEFSLYLLAAELRVAGKTMRYPSKDIEGDTIEPEFMKRFNEIYQQHKSQGVEETINVDYDYFSNLLSTIKRKFKKAFGKNLADKTVIQKDTDYGGFGLIVTPNSIDLDS